MAKKQSKKKTTAPKKQAATTKAEDKKIAFIERQFQGFLSRSEKRLIYKRQAAALMFMRAGNAVIALSGLKDFNDLVATIKKANK